MFELVTVHGLILVVSAPWNPLSPATTSEQSGCIALGTCGVDQLTATSPEQLSHFGAAVAIQGGLAMVGRPLHRTDDSSPYVGDVTVFRLSGDQWNTDGTLEGDGEIDIQFGAAVALDDDLVVVGAPASSSMESPSAGAAYVFRWNGDGWQHEARLTLTSPVGYDAFGEVTAIDGATVVVAAPYRNSPVGADTGAVYIYGPAADSWVQLGEFTASDAAAIDYFGSAIDIEGDMLVVGAPRAACPAGPDCGAVYVFGRDEQGQWSQQAKLITSDPTGDERFGSAVDIFNGSIFVGAPFATDGIVPRCGSIYAFGRTGGAWVETAKIVAAIPNFLSWFGGGVRRSEHVLAVGESRLDCAFGSACGAVHLFSYLDGAWSPLEVILHQDNSGEGLFGVSLGLNEDRMIVGAPGAYCDNAYARCGKATIYDLGGPDCNCNGVPDPCDVASESSTDCNYNNRPDECDVSNGASQDCEPDGIPDECASDCQNNGIPDTCDIVAGTSLDCNADTRPDECGVIDACRVSTLADPIPTLSNGFGKAVAVDGQVAIIGEVAGSCNLPWCLLGSAHVFHRSESGWTYASPLVPSDGAAHNQFGASVAVNGDIAVVGAPDSPCGLDERCGAAYVFRFDGTAWLEEAKLISPQPEDYEQFGDSVAISGDTVVVGAPRWGDPSAGAAMVFQFDGEDWQLETVLEPPNLDSDMRFGEAVAIQANVLVIGAPRSDCDETDHRCGAAYVFRRQQETWIWEAKLTSSWTVPGDEFGYAVALDDGIAVIGSPFDHYCEEGTSCGGAYAFRYAQGAWHEEARLSVVDDSFGYDDQFGATVAVDGDWILVGTPYETCSQDTGCGAVYVYEFGGAGWNQVEKISAPELASGFIGLGYAVALQGTNAFLGAPSASCGGQSWCGMVFEANLIGADCDCGGGSDFCEIASGELGDANDNQSPDRCEVDLDLDGDADLHDLSAFVLCFDGGLAPIEPGCDRADVDHNAHVELPDAAVMVSGLVGP